MIVALDAVIQELKAAAPPAEAIETAPGARRPRWLLIVAIVIVLAALSTVASVVVSK